MDVSKFNSESDGFELFDYFARFSFKTDSSISFDINDEDLTPNGGGLITEKGWIDVHYPCDSFYKIRMRIKMQEEDFRLKEPVYIDCHPGDKTLSYHDTELMVKYINRILKELKLNASEHYEVNFILGGKGFLFEDVAHPDRIS